MGAYVSQPVVPVAVVGQAPELLPSVYEWFTEADLIDAKALQGELEESR
jgi:hypothetical protein